MTTIRGRILLMLLTGLTVVLTAGGAAVYWIAESNLMRQFDAGLETRAHTLASLVSYEPPRLVFASEDGPAETLRETYFELRTRSGEMLKRSGNLADTFLPRRAALEDDLVFDDVELPGDIGGRAVWLAFWPRVEDEDDEDEEQGEEEVLTTPPNAPELIVVVAALDRGPVDRALATLLGALVVVGCILAITVAVLVAVGVRWGLVPLDRLSRQLAGVSGKTISKRFDDAAAPRELAPIYQELNRMLDRVERILERERSFADAAAHELRTPLAELRATAEVAIRWPDTGRATASLRELLSIGREMERLVESLLLISRGNANAVPGTRDDVPLASIVQGCLNRAAGPINAKRLKLTIDLDERPTLAASRDTLEIIARNLIDNAVQYTPSDGSITIRGEDGTNGSPSLIVENGPVSLNEDDVPRMFEPFWRTEQSRSDREHVGLGLTVVHQIADASGLRVDAALVGDRLQIRVSATA